MQCLLGWEVAGPHRSGQVGIAIAVDGDRTARGAFTRVRKTGAAAEVGRIGQHRVDDEGTRGIISADGETYLVSGEG